MLRYEGITMYSSPYIHSTLTHDMSAMCLRCPTSRGMGRWPIESTATGDPKKQSRKSPVNEFCWPSSLELLQPQA